MERGDGLSEPLALVYAFWSGKWGAAADFCRLRVVVNQWAAPMVRLPSYDERPADRTGQVARGQAGHGRGNLAVADGKVFTTGDGVGFQGRLRDRAASRQRRIRDRGRDL